MNDNSVSAPGVYVRSLSDGSLSFRHAIESAAAEGFKECLFPSPFALSRGLRSSEVSDSLAYASDRGIAVSVGIRWLHPARLSDDRRLKDVGAGDPWAGLHRMLEVAASLDSRDLLTVIGRWEDRLDPIFSWNDQLASTRALLQRLAPTLRSLDIRLAIKTHEAINSREVGQLVESVGTDVLSVALDPVNALARLEDPVESAARLAPLVSQVFLDDAVLIIQGDRAKRLLCNLGHGVVDWRGILDSLSTRECAPKFWIELHRGQFSNYPFDREWLTENGTQDVGEYLAVMKQAVAATRRVSPAELCLLEANQARSTSRLQHARHYLSSFERDNARRGSHNEQP